MLSAPFFLSLVTVQLSPTLSVKNNYMNMIEGEDASNASGLFVVLTFIVSAYLPVLHLLQPESQNHTAYLHQQLDAQWVCLHAVQNVLALIYHLGMYTATGNSKRK